MASRTAERRERVTRGTGNVFADLGFPDAAEREAKLRLAYALNQALDGRKLSQADAAKVLGVTQPKVSALRHYKLVGFSVERLMNLLTALDQDVQIVIRPKPRSLKVARIIVVAAYDVQMAPKPKAASRQHRSHRSLRRQGSECSALTPQRSTVSDTITGCRKQRHRSPNVVQ